MVTFTSGQISCTARAMICARSWRISSSAWGSSFIVWMAMVASASIGHCRSQWRPSTVAEIAFLPSEVEIDPATSAAVMPAGKLCGEPSGNVREISAIGLPPRRFGAHGCARLRVANQLQRGLGQKHAAVGAQEFGRRPRFGVAPHPIAGEMVKRHQIGPGQRLPQRIRAAPDEGLQHEIGLGIGVGHGGVSFQSGLQVKRQARQRFLHEGVDPAIDHLLQRHGIEEVMLEPARTARDDKTGIFQHLEMFHHPEPAECAVRFDLGQALAVARPQCVEDRTPGGIVERLENRVEVGLGAVRHAGAS
jgi:hypothetical protein